MSDEETAPQPQDPPATDESASAPALASEISRRVGAILDAVEREAARLREEARADAARYLEDARIQADTLVAERRQRIAALSDELVAKSEAVVSRLDDAEPVRDGFENLVRALGDAAERLAHEAESEPELPPRPASHPAGDPIPAPAAPEQARPAFADPVPAAADPASSQPPAFSAPPPPAPQQSPPRGPVQAGGHFEEQPQPARAPSPAGFAQSRGSSWRELDDARVIAIQMATAGSTRAEVGDHLRRTLGVPDPSRTLDEVFGSGTGAGDRVPWTGTGG